MKKILSTLILISFLAFLIVPQIASAVITEAPEACELKYDFSDIDSECDEGEEVNIADHGMCCLLNTLYSITDWIFVILMGLVGIFVIMGAFILLTAAGAPEKVVSGRNYILYAAIGMVVAFLAKAVPNMIKLIVGIGS